MRYFKSSGNHLNDIDRIVGELINIVYGMTFYENGEMLNEPKPKHNAYLIDSVEYEVHPNISLIFLNTDHQPLRETLSGRIGVFENAIQNKFGKRDVPIGIPGSTQYLMIEDVRTTRNETKIGYVYSDNNINWSNTLPSGFSHLVYLISKIGTPLNLPIPGISANRFTTEVNLMSLSSIIYDDSNVFNITDGDRSPDFPTIDKYNNYQNGKILKEFIHWNDYTGLLGDVMYNSGFKALLETKQRIPNPIKIKTLLWAKWEWLKLYTSRNQSMSWLEQINRGLLDEDDSLTDESLVESEKKSKNNERYTCFITGIPIYEDCYVFDIYERTVREHVPSDEVDNYEDAVVITEEMLKKEQDTVKKAKQKEAAAKKAAAAARKAENTRRQRQRKGGYSDDENEQGDSTVLASQVKNKKETKEKKKEEKPIAKKEAVIKRGTKKQVELVLIERTIKYTSPKCILISPWFIHYSKEADPVNTFEKATNTKVHLYRTFCPVTLNTVILELPINDMYKEVLADMNVKFTMKSQNVSESSKAFLVKEFSTTDILNTSQYGKIIARFATYHKYRT